jgi:hypothetical protein
MPADSKQNKNNPDWARPDTRIFRDNETVRGKLETTFRNNKNWGGGGEGVKILNKKLMSLK